MNYFAIFKGRARALVTDIPAFSVLLIIALVCVCISVFGSGESSSRMPVAVINADKGPYGEEMIKILQLEPEYEFYETDEDSAEHDIADNKAHGMIYIKPDFSDKITAGEYESLVSVTVMSDSYDLTAFSEVVINDAIKVWMESLTERKLESICGASEEEILTFREDSKDIWAGKSLIDAAGHMLEEEESASEEDEYNYSGIRWYAALSLFYLMIAGSWMCGYGSGGLIKRVLLKGGNLGILFAVQALPGILVTMLGLIPVLFAEKSSASPLLLLLAYFLYALGASGMALVVCSLSGKFSNLVLLAPVMTMAVSLLSGLLVKLPDWAGFWDILSVVLPGHFFHLAVQGKPFITGALITGIAWFVLGMLFTRLLGKVRRS